MSTPLSLPLDVWTEVLEYAFDARQEYSSTSLTESTALCPCKELWLLCRTLSAALDEWSRLAVYQQCGPQRNLQLPPLSTSSQVAPLHAQKRTLLALTRSPKELLRSFKLIRGNFMSLEPEDKSAGADHVSDCLTTLLHKLHQVTRIQGPFFRCSRWLRILDLTQMKELKTLGDDCFSFSTVEVMLLPESVETVGDRFLSSSRIRFLDLSRTRLTTVGGDFASSSPIQRVDLPATLNKLGTGFLAYCANLTVVDLSNTTIRNLANYFLSESTVERELLLPRSIETADHWVCFRCKASSLDLSSTSLERVGSNFLASSKIDNAWLPSSLTSVGDGFLGKLDALRIHFSTPSLLERIGNRFLSSARVCELSLPPSLRVIGHEAFSNFQGNTVDLSETAIESVGNDFLSGSVVDQILLPSSLKVIGDRALNKCSARVIKVVTAAAEITVDQLLHVACT